MYLTHSWNHTKEQSNDIRLSDNLDTTIENLLQKLVDDDQQTKLEMGVVTTAQELAWNTTISEIKMHQWNIVPIKWLDAN
jgi:hypothetical protein